jgi:hypothetical protein
MVFLVEALVLFGAGWLHLVTDHTSPLGPAWLIGALLAAVAWRVFREHGEVRGALTAQLLPAVWLPFFVSVYPTGPCATSFLTTLSALELLFVGNGVLLLVALAVRYTPRNHDAPPS